MKSREEPKHEDAPTSVALFRLRSKYEQLKAGLRPDSINAKTIASHCKAPRVFCYFDGDIMSARQVFCAAAMCMTALSVSDARAATPIGGATLSGNTISGWACDPAIPSTAVFVDFYVDGVGATDVTGAILPSWARYKGNNTYSDNYAGGVYATLPSSSQSASCNGGNHGFSFTVPQSFRSTIGPGAHDVYLFMRNTNGIGPNPQMYATPFKLNVTGSQTVVDAWHNNFQHSCSSWKDKTWAQNGSLSYVFTPGVLCQDDYPGGLNPISDPFWALGSRLNQIQKTSKIARATVDKKFRASLS
jgi:hypothetical protein